MTMTGLDVFDKTVHETNSWLKDLMYELGSEDRQHAYLALRSTLKTLRDRLTLEEVKDLGAQLPMLVRGLYYEGWNPSQNPMKIKDKAEFLSYVQEEMPRDLSPQEIEDMVRAVFKLLFHRISKGEINHIKQSLPKEIENLWPTRVH